MTFWLPEDRGGAGTGGGAMIVGRRSLVSLRDLFRPKMLQRAFTIVVASDTQQKEELSSAHAMEALRGVAVSREESVL